MRHTVVQKQLFFYGTQYGTGNNINLKSRIGCMFIIKVGFASFVLKVVLPVSV